MKRPFLSAILILTISILAARPAWHAPDARLRIRFNIPRKDHANLFIPIPNELTPKDIAAFDDKGMVIPASPVMLNGKLIGAAVNAQKQAAPFVKQNLNLNASLYLLDAKGAQSLPYDGLPVHLTRLVKDVTTRAHAGTEILRMIQNLHLIPFPQASVRHRPPKPQFIETDYFGNLKGRRNWLNCIFPKSRPEARACVISTAFTLIPKQTTLSFGAKQLNVAWTVLLDGKPVADWITAGQDACGLPVSLSPGLHAIQLVSIQSQHERLPELIVRPKAPKAKPQRLQSLLPARIPETLKVEFKDVPQLAPEATAQLLHAFACNAQEPQKLLGIYKVSTPDKRSQFISDTGKTLTLPAPNILIADAGARPATRLTAATQTFTFPTAPTCWQLSQAVNAGLFLKTPEIITAGQPIPLDLTLDVPDDIPAAYRKLVRIAVRQVPAVPGTTVPPTQYFPAPDRHLTIAPRLAPVSSRLQVTALLHTLPLAPPQEIQLVTPAEAAATPLRASGQQLFLNHTPATLIAPANLSRASSVEQKETTTIPPMTVYDQFLLTTMAPGASAIPDDPLFQWLPVQTPTGTDDSLAFLANLHQLLKAAPKLAVFIIQPQEAADPHNQTWKQKALFAAQAAIHNHIQPIFLILPKISGDRRFIHAKDAAFNAKVFTFEHQLDTIDLFTLAVLQKLDTKDWKTARGIHVKSLNDNARIWLFKHIR